jgi:hypothetical protein
VKDEKIELKTISASRIKTYENCSWMYYCNYILRIPQKNNDGALRGSICHDVFELLILDKHRHHYESIVQSGSIMGCAPINRLVMNYLRRSKIMDYKQYELVNEMILVGLKHDFHLTGGEIVGPEYKFDLTNESPNYKITGFIDKAAIYKEEKSIKIVDYKSSKKKFSGKDLEVNVQAMLYSLAAKKIWPDLKPVVQFLFLRFPKQPIQQLEFSEYQLEGFAESLERLNLAITNFGDSDCFKNFAADKYETKWMCQAGSWKCPYFSPFTYYTLEDGDGKILKSTLEKESLEVKEGQRVLKKHYAGCPRHKTSTSEPSQDDGFGF